MPDFAKREGEPSGDFRSDNDFLLGFFEEKEGTLCYRYDAERVIIEPWGPNSFRVRASKMPQMPEELWALDGKPEDTGSRVEIHEYSAEITNGKIKAAITISPIMTKRAMCSLRHFLLKYALRSSKENALDVATAMIFSSAF